MLFSKIARYVARIQRVRQFDKNCTINQSVKILSPAKVENFSQDKKAIYIGANSVIRGELSIFPGGKIEIGEDCYVGEGSRLWSATSMKIGNRVFISHNVNIHDTNSHSLDSAIRYSHFQEIMSKGHPSTDDFDIITQPVSIQNDVWIGFNSTILKGVTIGRNSIVAACSVVTKDIPEYVVVAGNPAKIVKELPIQES